MSDTLQKLARDVADHLRFLEESGVRELALPTIEPGKAAENAPAAAAFGPPGAETLESAAMLGARCAETARLVYGLGSETPLIRRGAVRSTAKAYCEAAAALTARTKFAVQTARELTN